MIDIENKAYQPTVEELSSFVSFDCFDEFLNAIEREFLPKTVVEFSGDKNLFGWNIKLKKCGRTLCTLYPRQGFFKLLLVVGKKEKERVEKILPTLGEGFREVYMNTPEGMGQKWMLFSLDENSADTEDIIKVIRIRRESK